MTSEKDANRLRPPAAKRLAADEQRFDLHLLAEDLCKEDHPAVDGHRQMTIFKKGAVTMVIFTFDPKGELKEHAANGVVTIQCVAGSLLVETESEQYELESGQLVALAPKLRHSVKAQNLSIMLLTVHQVK